LGYKLYSGIYQRSFSKHQKNKKAGDKAVLKKIAKLLDEIKENPNQETCQIELLKYGLAGKHARRINHKHRLVYSI